MRIAQRDAAENPGVFGRDPEAEETTPIEQVSCNVIELHFTAECGQPPSLPRYNFASVSEATAFAHNENAEIVDEFGDTIIAPIKRTNSAMMLPNTIIELLFMRLTWKANAAAKRLQWSVAKLQSDFSRMLDPQSHISP